jgi:uncharacterized protein
MAGLICCSCGNTLPDDPNHKHGERLCAGCIAVRTPKRKRVLQNIIRTLVDSPDQVSDKAISVENAIVLEVAVAPTEAGQIIGKEGRTARSIRTLLASMGGTAKTRYSLDISANR